MELPAFFDLSLRLRCEQLVARRAGSLGELHFPGRATHCGLFQSTLAGPTTACELGYRSSLLAQTLTDSGQQAVPRSGEDRGRYGI